MWISVSDELPDQSDEVLFYIYLTCQIELGKLNHTTKMWMIPHREKQYEIGVVTHWMPLPEPPKD